DAAVGDDAAALAAYETSLTLAQQVHDASLTCGALAGVAATLRRTGQVERSRQMLDAAAPMAKMLPPSHDAAYCLINLAREYRQLRAQPGDDVTTDRSFELLTAAREMASTIGDPRAASYAAGDLGRLYEDARRYPEALELTRRAIVATQEVSAPE